MDQELWSSPWNLFLFCFFVLKIRKASYLNYPAAKQSKQGGQQHRQGGWQQQVGGGHYGRGWLQVGGQGQEVADKAKVANNTKLVKNANLFSNKVVYITPRW